MRDYVCKMSICVCLTGLPRLLINDGWNGSLGLDFHVSNFIKKAQAEEETGPRWKLINTFTKSHKCTEHPRKGQPVLTVREAFVCLPFEFWVIIVIFSERNHMSSFKSSSADEQSCSWRKTGGMLVCCRRILYQEIWFKYWQSWGTLICSV